MELRAVKKVRFARGQARNRRWCAVEHREIDWAARSSFTEEFEVVIMIKVVTEEMHGSDRVPDLNTDCERALVGHGTFSTRAKWRSSTSACSSMLEKYLTPPTLSETPGYASRALSFILEGTEYE